MQRINHDNVCQEIQKRILLGELLPGMRLSEVALAAELGVSRTPLREAFHTLVSQGVLEHRDTGGVFVKTATEADIRALYEMRLWLEPEVARKVAVVATEAQRETIREACRKEAALYEKVKASTTKPQDYAELNAFRVFEVEIPFHGVQCEAANNPFLSRVVEQMLILKRSWMLQNEQNFSVNDVERAAREHAAIADAILTQDCDRAARLTREHITTAYYRILRVWNQNENASESKPENRIFFGLYTPEKFFI
ncbi:MAG: GntR family transcriptional regulator [Planctomycetia bacterium]|nr:GntR family transcriptional regulator [Planctomycetia bacterium]